MWKFSACRLQATVDAGLPASLPAWLPPRLACSTRLELATCACLHCRVYCTTIYKPLHRPGQARRRPYGQLMHAMLPECAATPPRCHCLCLLSRTFPLIFLHAVWACGARTGTRHLQTPPFPLPPRQRFLCIYSWPLSIDRVDKAYPFSLQQQIRANATGRGI